MVTNKKILIAGAGGFIGGHLSTRLASHNKVTAIDMKPLAEWFQYSEYSTNIPNFDCRNKDSFGQISENFDLVMNLACDHGGVGYLTNNDYRCLTDVTVNLNLLDFAVTHGVPEFLFASTACVYNKDLQSDSGSTIYLSEDDAWPAWPDMKYGLEKLYSEELCLATQKEHGIKMYIPRIHGCYGPYNHFNDIKEKAPNALMRKAMTEQSLEVWGDGSQRRSFMYVDDVVDGILRLLVSDYHLPINLGSDQVITLGEVAMIAKQIAQRDIPIQYIDGPIGVASRCSDNTLIQQVLGWKPEIGVDLGMRKTAEWIREQI